jgi:dTMP kinase
MKYFIIEGPDGVGKTTLVQFLYDYLRISGKRKTEVLRTRHPGGTPIGEEIRTLVKNRTDLKIEPYTQQILLAADYIEYIETNLKTALEKGTICIADRCNLISGMIYGYADGLAMKQIKAFQNVVLASGFPDCHVIILHAEPSSIADRRHDDDGKACKFEARGDAFHKKVNDLYASLNDPNTTNDFVSLASRFESPIDPGADESIRERFYEMFPANTVSFIDASQRKKEVFKAAIKILEKVL